MGAGVHTLPSSIQFVEDEISQPRVVLLQVLSSQEKAPYTPGGNKAPFLRPAASSYFQGREPYTPGGNKAPFLRPATSSYFPRLLPSTGDLEQQQTLQTPGQPYTGPKDVIYIF